MPGFDTQLRPGGVFAGYRLESLIGRGGMGSVWVGVHPDLPVRRAIKISVLGSEKKRLRFEREAQSLARVDGHPNVVRVHAFGVVPPHGYLVLDLVEGSDLNGPLEDGPLAVDRALRIAAAVASALTHLHEAGIVHRDVKPGNVLLDEQDRPLLTDFGVARDLAQSRMTQTGALVGTPYYLAPECLDPRLPSGPPVDIYALGVVLYQLLTGELPFFGEGMDYLFAATRSETPLPSATRPELSAALDTLVIQCMDADAEQRPTASQVAEALEALARGEKRVSLTQTAVGTRLLRRLRRRDPRVWLALLGLIAALTAASVWGATRLQEAKARQTLTEHVVWASANIDEVWFDPTPTLDDAELARRAAQLRTARRWLNGPEALTLGTELNRVQATRRLLAHRAGEEVELLGSQEGGAELLVDAQVLADRGHATRALRLLRKAEATEAAEEARSLRLEWLAPGDPEAFFVLLRETPAGSPARARGERHTSQAFEALSDQLAEAMRPGAPPAAVAQLAAVVNAALDAHVELATLATLKREALEQEASAWDQRLAKAAEHGGALVPLAELQRALIAPPRVYPGPALTAALLARLDRQARTYLEQVERGADSLDSFSQLIREDAFVCRELGRRWKPSPAFLSGAAPSLALLATQAHDLRLEAALAALRWGLPGIMGNVLARLTPGDLDEAQQLASHSRAARLVGAWRTVRWETSRAPREAALLELERVTGGATGAWEGDGDLAPISIAEAHLLAGDLLLEGPQAKSPDRLERCVAHALAARPHLESDPERLRSSYELESTALAWGPQPERGLAPLVAAIKRFSERINCPEERRRQHELDELAILHRRHAQQLVALGRLDEAKTAYEASIRYQSQSQFDQSWRTHEDLARLLARQERPDEALRVLLPGFPAAFEDNSYTRFTLELLRDSDRKAFKKLRRQALRAESAGQGLRESLIKAGLLKPSD